MILCIRCLTLLLNYKGCLCLFSHRGPVYCLVVASPHWLTEDGQSRPIGPDGLLDKLRPCKCIHVCIKVNMGMYVRLSAFYPILYTTCITQFVHEHVYFTQH